MKDVVLALGGGGVKGNAHLGVLRVLERNGFRVRGLAGTSAGGLWGSLYAFGYTPAEIERRISQADVNSLFGRDPADGPAWLGLVGLRQVLSDALGDCRFQDLRLPFAVTAVDLDTARRVVIRRGPVVDAVLATIAVPGVFPAARFNGHTLVDGGVLDPVPVALARQIFPDLPVVGVALSPPLEDWNDATPPRLLGSLSFLTRYIERLRFSQALNVFMRSMDISGALLTELLLAADPPDVLIRPGVRGVGLLDNVDPAQVARLGEAAAEAALPALEQAAAWPASLRRRWNRTLARSLRPPLPMPYATEEA